MHSTTFVEKYCPFTSASIRKNSVWQSRTAVLPGQRRSGGVFRLPDHPTISVHAFYTVDDVPPIWDTLAGSAPALLSRPFLQAIETAPPDGMDFYYLIFYREEKPAGIAYFQRVRFEPDRAIKLDASATTGGYRLKEWLARQFRHTLLIAGNALLTGQHACYFSDDTPAELRVQLLEHAAWQLATYLRNQGKVVDAIVQKDIAGAQLPAYRSWRQSGYHALRFQPNMEIELQPDWRSFEDYLDAMSSKYRVRARRAVKKSRQLERRWLSSEEVRHQSVRLFALYEQIAAQSEFNLVHLHPDFFYEMKKHLGDQYEVLGYFQANKLIGFCTLLHHHGRAEAHFLGFEEEVNRSAQLYLNMLYDLIHRGIEQGRTHIGFARTAMEIKSSVGAEPEDLYVLTRSYSPLFNGLVAPVIRFLIQDMEWEQRRPFKHIV